MSKQLTGKVVSTKMQKTVVVEVKTSRRHPLYKKRIVRKRHFKAHNEDSAIKLGDKVKIIETRPISKDKHFRVLELVK